MSSPYPVLRRVRARARLGIGVEAVAVVAAVFALFAVASWIVDRALRLEVGYRVALAVGLAGGLIHLVHRRLLVPLAVPLDDDELALAVERLDPTLQQSLISGLQFQRDLAGGRPLGDSRSLMARVVAAMNARVDGLGLQRAVDARRIRRYAALLAACAIAAIAVVAVAPDTAMLWARRNLLFSAVEWPRATQLAFAGVAGDRLRLPRGDDLLVTVRATGVPPEQVWLGYRFASGTRGSEPMTLTGTGEFVFTLAAVLETAELVATGGDGETAPLQLELVDRPLIHDVQIDLDYPDYMQRAGTRVAATEGDIAVPRGGHLRFAAHSSKPLRSATLLFATDQRVPLLLDATTQALSGTIAPTDSGALSLQVIDVDRLDSATPPRWFVRVVEDRTPKVEFRPQGIGTMITPNAIVPGHLRLDDDYGLRTIAATFRVTGSDAPTDAAGDADPDAADRTGQSPSGEGAGWETAAVTGIDGFVAGSMEHTAEVAFDLRPLAPQDDPASPGNRIRPGHVLSLRFAATDNFGPGDPHRGESEPVVFAVVTRERLLTELNRRQQEQRREIELVIAETKADVAEIAEIVAPTAADDRAVRARERVLALSRKQRASGNRVRAVADLYRRILDELQNNRLFEPGKVGELDQQIVAPLRRLSAEDFPASAAAAQQFAEVGDQDRRAVTVAAYQRIITELERVLAQMTDVENLATLLEALRHVIKLQDAAIRETERRRSDDAGSLFDPPPRKDDKKHGEAPTPDQPK